MFVSTSFGMQNSGTEMIQKVGSKHVAATKERNAITIVLLHAFYLIPAMQAAATYLPYCYNIYTVYFTNSK